MMIGLGGVGKTTLIRGLFDNDDAEPDIRTEHYTEYHLDLIVEEEKPERRRAGKVLPTSTTKRRYSMFVGDYRGQNVGQLVGEFVAQQKDSYRALSYGFVNSLVLVIDVLPPTRTTPASRPNAARLNYHTAQWSETALDAVFGLLTEDTLSYVCLFVNKVDMIPASQLSVVEDRVAELRSRLERKAKENGAAFQSVMGSALEGRGVIGVREDLRRTSVRA